MIAPLNNQYLAFWLIKKDEILTKLCNIIFEETVRINYIGSRNKPKWTNFHGLKIVKENYNWKL